jgi:hypothetical protein
VALAIPTPDWLDFPSAVKLASGRLDAQEVRLAILRAAEDGSLAMRYEPAFLGRGWRDFKEPDDPLWSHGLFFLEGRNGKMTKFEPEISRASLMSLFAAIPAAEEAQPAGLVSRAKGPRPVKLERVKAAMLEAIGQHVDVGKMREKEWEARFGASRDTCRKAWAAIQSTSADK